MSRIINKSLAFSAFALLTIFTLNVEARSPYWARAHDPRVNTRVERQFDINHDGRIENSERRLEKHARVNTPREAACDRNHNGFVGPREAGCL